MRKVDLYEMGEEVYVKAKIVGIVVEDGDIKYRLKNDITGKEYGYAFTSDQLKTAEALKPNPVLPHTRPGK